MCTLMARILMCTLGLAAWSAVSSKADEMDGKLGAAPYGAVSIAVIGASWWWRRQRRLRAARRARLAGLVRIALLPNLNVAGRAGGRQDYKVPKRPWRTRCNVYVL